MSDWESLLYWCREQGAIGKTSKTGAIMARGSTVDVNVFSVSQSNTVGAAFELSASGMITVSMTVDTTKVTIFGIDNARTYLDTLIRTMEEAEKMAANVAANVEDRRKAVWIHAESEAPNAV
jgi:hypothetical protein